MLKMDNEGVETIVHSLINMNIVFSDTIKPN